jgi:hypothetical protein
MRITVRGHLRLRLRLHSLQQDNHRRIFAPSKINALTSFGSTKYGWVY